MILVGDIVWVEVTADSGGTAIHKGEVIGFHEDEAIVRCQTTYHKDGGVASHSGYCVPCTELIRSKEEAVARRLLQ